MPVSLKIVTWGHSNLEKAVIYHLKFWLQKAKFKLSDILQFISGTATIPPIGAPSVTLAFKHDCERQEYACLSSFNIFSTSLTLPVQINNLETIKKSFKVAMRTT